MKKFFGRGKIDVEDPSKYSYLDPLWEILRRTPEQGITANQMGEQSKLDPAIAVPMIQELSNIYQRKMTKELFLGDISKIDTSTFWEQNLKDSWLFDKMMLLCTKVNTMIPNDGWDQSEYVIALKNKWLESKGM